MAPSVSLRLVADNGENVMLTLRPEEILTLDALLALLRQLNPAGPNVCALEYEDDEGDLVTVTNDEEVGARRGWGGPLTRVRNNSASTIKPMS